MFPLQQTQCEHLSARLKIGAGEGPAGRDVRAVADLLGYVGEAQLARLR